jgi:aarF domain-containing kinase
MLVVLDFIQIMHAKFAFKWVLTDLRGNLEAELDFEQEAANAEACRRQLSARLPYLHVPRVRRELTSSRVLTTEFIHGLKISDSLVLNTLFPKLLQQLKGTLTRDFRPLVLFIKQLPLDP